MVCESGERGLFESGKRGRSSSGGITVEEKLCTSVPIGVALSVVSVVSAVLCTPLFHLFSTIYSPSVLPGNGV